MTLYVDESGRGNDVTVVLLHGVGTSGWMWRRLDLLPFPHPAMMCLAGA